MSKVRRRSKFPTPCGLPRSAIDDRRNRETLAPETSIPLGGDVSDNVGCKSAFVCRCTFSAMAGSHGSDTRR